MIGLKVLCPFDKCEIAVSLGKNSIACPNCDRNYSIEQGVLRLVNSADNIYEGAYRNCIEYLPKGEKFIHVWPLWLINSGYPWYVRKHIPAGKTVLDIGCAGGVKYFGRRYEMIGMDLSFISLLMASGNYRSLVQADIRMGIPLPDKSVDAVISSFFWEHIDPKSKLLLVDEFHRVLRAKGRLVFLFDIKTQNPLLRWMEKKDPELFEKHFIQNDYHDGYQTSKENLELFFGKGFVPVTLDFVEKTPVLSPSVYEKLQYWEGAASLAGRLIWSLNKSKYFYFHTLIVRVVDTLAARLFPDTWARCGMFTLEKCEVVE